MHFPATRVLASDATMKGKERTINITLIGKVLPTDSLSLALSSRLKFYGLEGAKINIIQGDNPDLSGLVNDNSQSVRSIYEMAQASIADKQMTIDSLRNVIDENTLNDTIAGRLAPEINVLFPQIRELAVTRAVFGNMTNATLDTTHLALVSYSSPLNAAKRTELARFLEARLRLKSVSIIDIGSLSQSKSRSDGHNKPKK